MEKSKGYQRHIDQVKIKLSARQISDNHEQANEHRIIFAHKESL